MPPQYSTETSPLLGHQPSSPPAAATTSAQNAPHDIEAHSPPATPTNKEARATNTGLGVRIAAAMYSFVVLGLLTSSVGAMLPHLARHYALSDARVALVFFPAGPLGYVLAAALANGRVHARLGRRGVAALGPALHLCSSLALAASPPSFAVVLLAFAGAAAGTGLLDGSWCAWAAGMGSSSSSCGGGGNSSANAVSGLLHGSFSVGAAAGPFLAGTVMASSAESGRWYEWYYVLAASSAIELAVLLYAFRHEDASRYRLKDNSTGRRAQDDTSVKAVLMHLATWVSAAYFLAYVGTEAAISGWVVSFMTRARNASPSAASLASSGFWAGMAVGRVALGAVTDRMGVSLATFVYFVCVVSFEILFAALRTQTAALVSLTSLGFFMGPLFPSGVVLLTRLLPKEDHVTAVSLVASVGQVGGALLPFGIGAVVQGIGISVFQYAIIALSFLGMVIWIVFSRIRPVSAIVFAEERDEGGITT